MMVENFRRHGILLHIQLNDPSFQYPLLFFILLFTLSSFIFCCYPSIFCFLFLPSISQLSLSPSHIILILLICSVIFFG
ncbi:hypothetical protein EYC80_004368 [Monilinia laxa]|uniref:Uncharacterized protein n=1 Tax=Monilinia laxa TaxID=61186 RepID=A0A5N6KN61_MONLA|nr:hypothetical protein EYC80_004368 [Monilinia laxa]